MANYSEPTNPIGTYNPCYMSNNQGESVIDHWNTCIHGSPTQTGATVLANCTGWCQGRMLETYMECTGYAMPSGYPHPFVGFAMQAGQGWIDHAESLGWDTVNEPVAGSVFATAVHVGFVESYDEDSGFWKVSESGYGGSWGPWHYGTHLPYGSPALEKVGNQWISGYSGNDHPGDNVVKKFIVVPDISPGPGPTPGPVEPMPFFMYLKNWNNEY